MLGYVLAGIMTIVVVVLLFGPWRTPEKAARPIVRSTITLPASAPVYGLGIAVSPDGTSLVYSSTDAQLNVRRLDQTTAQPIPGAIGLLPTFSPDGQWLAFFDNLNRISKVSLTGSAPEALYESQMITPGLWWTPNNEILFGTYSGGVNRIPATGGTPVSVTALDTANGEISHRFPQLLPDGKSLIYTAKTKTMASFDEALIIAERLGGSEHKVLVKGGYYGRYLPSGHLIYLRGNTLFAVKFDPDKLEISGTPTPVERGGAVDNGGTICLGVSENGVAVFSTPATYSNIESISLGWLDRTGATTALYDTARNYALARISPDGNKIALAIASANDDIWIFDIPRGLLSRLTHGWGNNSAPIWSPDGASVIYSAEKGQAANIYRTAWDGSGSEERLTVSPNPQRPTDVSRDGKFVTYEENGDIWILPLDSSGAGSPARKPYPYIQTRAYEVSGLFSPDGKWLAYTSDESGKPEVYVVSFPKRGAKQQVSIGGGVGGGFSRDGKQLVYGNGRNLMVVDVRSGDKFEVSSPHKLLTMPDSVTIMDVAPDGKRFLTLLKHGDNAPVLNLEVVTEWFDVVAATLAQSKK